MRGACLRHSLTSDAASAIAPKLLSATTKLRSAIAGEKTSGFQRKLKFVQRAAHRSRQLLRARGRAHACAWGADEQLVFQPVAQPAQRVARGRLAEMQAFGGWRRDAPLAQNRLAEDQQQVQDRESADSSSSFISCIAIRDQCTSCNQRQGLYNGLPMRPRAKREQCECRCRSAVA